MKLFETLDDLKPFIFRITDNGGATADRFTVTTCDGDYYAMSETPFHPQGVGMTGEGIDVAGIEERVEEGKERDIRWIDLPADCQRCVLNGLNMGFEDYLEAAPVAETRDDALDFEGWSDWTYHSRKAIGTGERITPIYKDGDRFRVRRDELDYSGEPDPDFDNFREALLYTLPADHDLSGPEYFSTVDLWDTEGGPAPLWDSAEEEEGGEEEA